MNIVVLIKQVPDTAARIQDRVANGTVDLDGITWVVNPYDEYAVEEALQLKEAHGGSVTLVTLGPDRAESALKDMLALGADEAIHVWDPAFENLGPRGRAQVLAAALGQIEFDLVLGGWKGVDEDEGLTPIYLATALDLPHVSFVTDIEVADGTATVRREIESGHDIIQVPLPAIMTAQKGLNEPRYASLKGIMAVKRKEIPRWDARTLGLDSAALATASTETRSVSPPPERPSGRIIEGSPEEAARELVSLLHNEAKVL